MARLIVKSPYIKCRGGGGGAGGYLKYIATRERVQIIADDRPPTRRQEQLIRHLLRDFPNIKGLGEYESYRGNVWTHIISLKREDAVRLGYDSAGAWRNLIRTHRNEIAQAMHIPLSDFRWYAAFHDEGDHPHIHLMAWSAKPGQAYLSKEGIHKIKSELTNDIFRQEMFHLHEQKSASRDELVRQARKELKNLTREMRQSLCSYPQVEKLMAELSQQLETGKGEKSYGYLLKNLKYMLGKLYLVGGDIPQDKEQAVYWLNESASQGNVYA